MKFHRRVLDLQPLTCEARIVNTEMIALKERIQEVRGPLLKKGIQAVHEAFADYMLLNPGCTLREMGAQFGYSPAWICTVINTDMFKAYFSERRNGIVVAIAEDLPSRLAAAAHLATERIMEVIEKTEDGEMLIDAFDKVLHRHGYAPNAKGMQGPAQVNVQNNVFYLNKNELAEARGALVAAHKPAELEVKGEHLESLPAP